jgi:hypothetical protein
MFEMEATEKIKVVAPTAAVAMAANGCRRILIIIYLLGYFAGGSTTPPSTGRRGGGAGFDFLAPPAAETSYLSTKYTTIGG